ncbi:MAG: hypothetical protein JW862_06770 [Anaerolineales bacterium]|nr:hypothetical protein [Anaerolineales bacterium]
MNNLSSYDHPISLRSGTDIFPVHETALEKLLNELLEHCPAAFILLADVSGQVIMVEGQRGGMDLVALASLVAGDLAASQEIARLSGEYQSYQLILREGQKYNTFISEAGKHLLLFVQVSCQVPLGWARLLIQETARQASEVMNTPVEIVDKLDLGLDKEGLSDLFGNALDAMWNG